MMKKTLFGICLVLTLSLSAKDYARDTYTGLLWQDTYDVKDKEMTYEEAESYCHNLKITDQVGWRVPTLKELVSLVDYKKYKPAILDGFEYTGNEAYWSSTPSVQDIKKEVWGVNFTSGKTVVMGRHYDRYVRCVKTIGQ
jgi:hypothetical protein